jgi:type 1 glutamine amidotransferase
MILRPASALATAAALLGLAAPLFPSTAPAADAPASPAAKPMRVLLITGGCCHNYAFQSRALIDGFKAKVPSDWTVVNEGGTGTRGQIALYDDPAWAKPYSVVVHNECFADTTDAAYIRKIVDGHRGGTPAVVVHCAMHTYRASTMDDWREFLGVTSMHHEHQSRYPVKIVAGDHPIMRGFPANWVTPMDELYILKKVWPGTQALATSVSEKTGESQPVVWVHEYKGTRVFGTTYGHSDDTFRDPIFIDLLTRGIVWASGSMLP